MEYLWENPNLALTLEADNTHVVKWWVDAAFAVQPDMKSKTGSTMSLWKVHIYYLLVCQKLNTNRSTKAKLLGVSNVMNMVLWKIYFLE